MKKQIFLITLIFVCASSAFAQKTEVKPAKTEMPKAADEKVKLPTIKEVFENYIKVIGGRAAIEKIKNRTMTGVVELPAMGLKGKFEILTKTPNKNIAIINLDGFGEIVEAFDGNEAWAKDPLQGLRVKTGKELEETKMTSGFYAFDLDLEKNYPKAVVSGLEKIGGADIYVVKADEDTTFYFDKQSGLMIQMNRTVTSPQGKVSSVTKFEDFRVVDGYKMAFKITQSAMGADFIFNTAEVKQNIEIGDERFSKPK